MGDTVNYRGWSSMDNRRANYDISTRVLRDGVNVDILTTGRVRRRRGIRQVLEDAGAHSIFSDGSGRMIWATANKLQMTDSNVSTITTLLTSTALALPLSYVALNGEIYFSNEYVNGKVNTANAYEPWGITPPSAAPSLSATAGERIVMVACTFVLASGEESGAPDARAVSCTDSPVIQVTSIPQSLDARVVATRLYVSPLNEDALYAEVDVPAGVTSYTLTGYFGRGEILKTHAMQPPPPGQLIEYSNGRIHIATGNIVFSTQPLRYGLCALDEDFLMFTERVTLLKAVDDGLYTSSDVTCFHPSAGTAVVQQRDVLPYRAIEGAAINLPTRGNDIMWLSERGFVRGSVGGSVQNLTESTIAMTRYERACMGLVEREGHKAVVAITQGGAANPLVHRDYTAAEVERRAEVE